MRILMHVMNSTIFFSNIGAQLEMNIPPSAISPLEYLTPTENDDLDISLKTNNTEVASIINPRLTGVSAERH